MAHSPLERCSTLQPVTDHLSRAKYVPRWPWRGDRVYLPLPTIFFRKEITKLPSALCYSSLSLLSFGSKTSMGQGGSSVFLTGWQSCKFLLFYIFRRRSHVYNGTKAISSIVVANIQNIAQLHGKILHFNCSCSCTCYTNVILTMDK